MLKYLKQWDEACVAKANVFEVKAKALEVKANTFEAKTKVFVENSLKLKPKFLTCCYIFRGGISVSTHDLCGHMSLVTGRTCFS